MRRTLLALILVAATPAVAASPVAASPPVARNVTLHARLADYPGYSACTGYVHPDGREYAVVGTLDGTSIVNVTDPDNPHEVAFIPGLSSQWREMKSYLQWIYVTTEAAGGGIQIIRMTDPENPVLVKIWGGPFNRAHTLAVDAARGILVANGTRSDNTQTGMRILLLDDPENPVEVGGYFDDYVHDSWVRNDTLYAYCIRSGVVRLFDFADPYFLREITSWSYGGAATHSGEAHRDGRWLYVCDERNYSTLKTFDMANPYVHELVEEQTVNPLAIVHNVHVKADTAFVAWYSEGVRLFDLSEPSLPVEWGWYDTHAGFSGGFHGVWDLAHFPSGTFIASDIEGGLFVFRADPNYGTVKLAVHDGAFQPISGADVVRAGAAVSAGGSGGGDSTRTQGRGWARLALAPGAHELVVSKFGFSSARIPASVSRGSRASLDVALLPAPSSPVAGSVVRRGDEEPIPGAIVTAARTPIRALSVAGGAYTLGAVPVGGYEFQCRRAGFAPLERAIDVENGVMREDRWDLLPAAWYDSCDTDRGWSTFTTGDHAATGVWERAVPRGTYSPAPRAPQGGAFPAPGREPHSAPQHEGEEEGVELIATGPVAPDDDATPGGAGACFVTGNAGTGSGVSDDDVDGGRTTLTSPPFDLTEMDDPIVGFERWYSMNSPGEPDSFLVELSGDGVSWVAARTLRESDPEWRFDAIRVKDYVVPTATTRIRFVAQDDLPAGVVEAAIDDVAIWDGTLAPSPVPPPPPAPAAPAVLDAPRPNPTREAAAVTLRLARPEHARVVIYDVAGRRVATLWNGPAPAGALVLSWDGNDARGVRTGSGVYWVRADAGGTRLLRRVVRVR